LSKFWLYTLNPCVFTKFGFIAHMLLLIAHVLLLTAQRSLLIAHKIASLPICIALCHARIIYVHSTSSEMARACIHLGVHDHPVSNGTCHESLDIAYQCVANEVI
jgi:hypothetical protein